MKIQNEVVKYMHIITRVVEGDNEKRKNNNLSHEATMDRVSEIIIVQNERRQQKKIIKIQSSMKGKKIFKKNNNNINLIFQWLRRGTCAPQM